MKILRNETILFNGDSITDALRDRSDKYSLAGYSKTVAECLNVVCPEIRCYNRGVGGDTSAQLLERLEKELEEIRPTVFSLLIGINDTWRAFDSGIFISEKTYGDNVEKILTLVEKYTKQIVVIEPFLLDVDPEKKVFRENLYPKIFLLREIARAHKTEFVPMDGVFAEACCHAPPETFSYDGVHPTEKGHALIAEEWLRRVHIEN